jgi:lipid-A-disaccharide synthase
MAETAPLAAPLFFLSAGEASGEHYGVALMDAVRERLPGARFFGLGGARMAERGFRPVVRAEDVAHMGITEVVRHAPYIYRQFQRLKRAITTEQPALAILIDFPDVNLRLAQHLHRHGVPVVYFVSPQLWAWKQRRIRRVQRYVDRMLVIFPFEESFYRERGVAADFVGHPLADQPRPAISREEFARQHGLDASKQWIALLPGSRRREVALNLPTMLKVMNELGADYEFLLPVAPTLERAAVAGQVAGLRAAGAAPTPPPMLVEDARAALYHARASVVASGTATVEAALAGNPFVVVYRLSGMSYAIARRFVKVPHVAMANLIAQRRLVPELIQQDFTAGNIVRELRPLLAEGPARAEMMAGLRVVQDSLRTAGGLLEGGRTTAIDRAAGIALELLHTRAVAGSSNRPTDAGTTHKAGAAGQTAGSYHA